MFSCLSAASSCAWDVCTGVAGSFGVTMHKSDPVVGFSETEREESVLVDKFHVSGDGQILAEAPLLQTRAYFEAEVINPGQFAIGVSYPHKSKKGHVGDDKTSWGIISEDLHSDLKAGDVVGCAYDMSDLWPRLMFYLNGEIIQNREVKAIRGEVFPAVSVSGDAELELNFGHRAFQHGPPDKFEGVMPTRDIMNESQ